MIEQLAEEHGVSMERIREMDMALTTYDQLFDDFDTSDRLNYIIAMLKDFSEKERAFMIFLYGVMAGVRLGKRS